MCVYETQPSLIGVYFFKKKKNKSIFQECPFRFDFTCEWAPETLFLGYLGTL